MKLADVLAQLDAAGDGDLDLPGDAYKLHGGFIAWALLAREERPRRVVLPTALVDRRKLARSGVLFAAQRRGIPLVLNGESLEIATILRERAGGDDDALPGFDWKRYDELLVTEDGEVEDRLTRLRVIPDLEDGARRPPPPDDGNRRYRWIDNTGAAGGLEGLEVNSFNGDADQILYEAIDNVHKWASATQALASCAVTMGGGSRSFNRFHIVVMDDGVGVVRSVEAWRETNGRQPWEEQPKVRRVVKAEGVSSVQALLRLLVCEAQGGREVEPADAGQGLHAVGVLSGRWSGSLRWFTADGKTCTWIGRTGSDGKMQSGVLPTPRLSGTMLHVTLNAQSNTSAKVKSQAAPLIAVAS